MDDSTVESKPLKEQIQKKGKGTKFVHKNIPVLGKNQTPPWHPIYAHRQEKSPYYMGSCRVYKIIKKKSQYSLSQMNHRS